MKKKLVSLLLAAAMTMSVMSPFAGTAFAEEAAEQNVDVQVETVQATDESADVVQNSINDQSAGTSTGKEAEPEAVQQAGALFEALPAAGDVAAMTAEEKAAVSEQVAQALNAVDALSLADYDIFMASYGEMYDAVCNDLMAALMATAEDTPSDLSLRPMEETTGVYLTLVGYNKDQLQNFSLDQMLTMLTDTMGNPITVDSGYTNAWVYFREDDIDEYYTIGTGATVDLWDYDYSGDTITDGSYSIFLVLGKGDQMADNENHRYVITVELTTGQIADYYGDFVLRKNGSMANAQAAFGDNSIFDQLGMPGRTFVYQVSGYQADAQYAVNQYYGTEVEELLRRGIQLDVYPMSNFLNYRDNGAELTGAVTEQLFGDGYACNLSNPVTADNYMTADNLLCFVFSDVDSGRVIGYFGAAFTACDLQGGVTLRLWGDVGSGVTELDSDELYQNGAYFSGDLDTGATGNGMILNGYSYIYDSLRLPDEASEDQTYYVTMDSLPTVQKVYSGRYLSESAAQASGAADITEKVLRGNPNGLEVKPGIYSPMTVVLTDGSVLVISAGASKYTTYSGSNDIDPDFQITDVTLPNDYVSDYVADSVGGIQLDTYYRNDEKYEVGGYQLVLIKDQLTADQMKQLIPYFSTPEGVVVNSGSRVESGKTDLSNAVWSDSMADTVMYQVQVPGKKLKNYQVTFATQKDKGTLYIAGPDERFVNLTADNKYIHDILIANIGATDLEGVKVELVNPVHVKLDEYWTLNGDTIPAFTETSAYYHELDESGQEVSREYNSYANPGNIAKIRLLADGEGEISGTLRVTTADGQVREIKLTGIAANPHIVSGDLDDAVKFVPYSYMVVTDNMYNWNRLTFKITEGTLPAGMQLYEATGEIYGTPTETGDFTFTVEVDYGSSRFQPSTATYTLHVAENGNRMVYEQTDEGYEIQVPLGVEQGEGTYDFLLTDITQDQLYVSEGVHPEFMGLWLNGEKLVRGVDYTSVSGSTRITIKSQTLQEKAYTDDYNTIAAEFRVDGDRENELKRTAQNFRLGEIKTSTSDDNQNGSSGGGSSDNSQDSTAADSAAEDAAAQAAAQAAALAAKGVNLRFYIVDEADEPMAGVKVELHSTPRTGVTDSNGCVAFSGVEFGKHTLTVYGEDGEILASKSFELVSGSFGTNGDVITVMGGSTLSIRVKAANGVLSFVRVDLPQTGDESNMVLWVIVLAAAVCLFVGVNIYKKKRNDVTSDDQI